MDRPDFWTREWNSSRRSFGGRYEIGASRFLSFLSDMASTLCLWVKAPPRAFLACRICAFRCSPTCCALRAMGIQRESRSLLLVVVQDAKVLVVGSKGQRCALWSGLSGARRPLTRWGSRGRAKSPSGRGETPKTFPQSGVSHTTRRTEPNPLVKIAIKRF